MFISTVMSLITFYIQNALNKLTHYPPATWESQFTPSTMDFCSKAVLICCSASFNSAIVFGIAGCSWLLQDAKIWVNLMR